MPPFNWDSKYETGIDSIDGQHVALFQSAKNLHDSFLKGLSADAITHTLNHLLVYCSTHLEDEEAHMRAASYPSLRDHQAEHRDLMTRVYHLRDQYLQGETSVALDLSLLIVTWFRRHILEHDQRFADFLRERGS